MINAKRSTRRSCDECDEELLSMSGSSKLKLEKRPLAYKYILHFDEIIESPEYYRELSNDLSQLTESDELDLIFNSDGGYVSSAVQICNLLIKTKAKTKAIIYNAYSAACMIAFCCDSIEIMQFGSIMIHDVSYATSGKNGSTKDLVDFISKNTGDMIRRIYKTFLTESELESLFNAKDIWLMEAEVKKRLARWVPQRKLLAESEVVEPVSAKPKGKTSKKG